MNTTPFENLYQTKLPTYEGAQGVLVAHLDAIVKGLNTPKQGKPAIRCEVRSKGIKSANSLLAKAKEKNLEGDQIFKEIHDIVRATIVCNNLNEIETIVQSLKAEAKKRKSFRIPRFIAKKIREDDCVNNPRENGYRAYHLLLEVDCPGHGWMVSEIQVKTLLQNSWGVLTHEDHYKSVQKPKEGDGTTFEETLIHELFKALGDNLAATDQIAQQIRNAIVRTEQVKWPDAGDTEGIASTSNTVKASKGKDTNGKPLLKDKVSGQPMPAYREGQTVAGLVVHIPLEYYGAIVQLADGTQGLCHISEITGQYVNRIEDHLQVGGSYDFVIKRVNGSKLELSRLISKYKKA